MNLLTASRVFSTLFPMPAGFMPLWVPVGRGVAVGMIPCLADEFVPDTGVFSIQPFNDGRSMIVGHPRAWAAAGARNLASAYLPEGL